MGIFENNVHRTLQEGSMRLFKNLVIGNVFLTQFIIPLTLYAMDAKKAKVDVQATIFQEGGRDDAGAVCAAVQQELLRAIEHNDVQEVQRALRAGAEVNYFYENGRTALMQAVTQEQKEMVQILLEGKADVDMPDNKGVTVLMLAVAQKRAHMVKLLLSSNARINVSTKDGVTPFTVALNKGQASTIQLLLDNRVNINGSDEDAVAPLTVAVNRGDNENSKNVG